MDPHEMAAELLRLADEPCRSPHGAEAYSCREYDRAALYDGQLPDCHPCQARDALDLLRAPWKAIESAAIGLMESVGKALDRFDYERRTQTEQGAQEAPRRRPAQAGGHRMTQCQCPCLLCETGGACEGPRCIYEPSAVESGGKA